MPNSWIEDALGSESPSPDFIATLRRRLSDTWRGSASTRLEHGEPESHRRWYLTIAAAVAALALLVGGLAWAARDPSSTSSPIAPTASDGPLVADTTTTSISSNAPSEASCALAYSVDTLRQRSWAFDGTVTAISEGRDSRLGAVPVATFDVHRWYKGGSGTEVTVQVGERVPQGNVVADDIATGVGSRLLVAGEPRWGGDPLDDAIAWTCEFTQPWSEDGEREWRTAFANEPSAAVDSRPVDSSAAPSSTVEPDAPRPSIARCTDPPFLGGPATPSPDTGGTVNGITEQHNDLFAGVCWDSRAEEFVFGATDASAATSILEAELTPDIAYGVVVVPRNGRQLADLQNRAQELLAMGIEASTGRRPWDATVQLDLPILDDETLQAVHDVFGDDIDAVCVTGADPATVPPDGPQPTSGDGWRLLADQTQRGEPYTVHVALDATEYEWLWTSLALDGERPPVDFDSQIVIQFGAVYSGSCPEIRLDAVRIDEDDAVVTADIVSLGGARACTADANPRAYLVAVDKSRLPATPFTVEFPHQGTCIPCENVRVTSLTRDPLRVPALSSYERWQILATTAARRVTVDNGLGEDAFTRVVVADRLGQPDATGIVQFRSTSAPLTRAERNAIRHALRPLTVHFVPAERASLPERSRAAVLRLAGARVVDGQLTITSGLMCGLRCGAGGTYVLERDANGTWEITGTTGVSWVS